MQKSAIWSVVAVAVVTVLVLAGAFILLRSGEEGAASGAAPETAPDAAPSGAAAAEPSQITFVPNSDQRPDCVAGGVGGIDLPCLGGEDVPGELKDVTVVNLWAWWCEPCQRELPITQAFADAHPDYSVVGVHADANAANGVAMMNELGVSFPSYQDDTNRFAGLQGLPGVVPIMLVYQSGKPVGMFPQAFNSLEELEAAVDGALS